MSACGLCQIDTNQDTSVCQMVKTKNRTRIWEEMLINRHMYVSQQKENQNKQETS